VYIEYTFDIEPIHRTRKCEVFSYRRTLWLNTQTQSENPACVWKIRFKMHRHLSYDSWRFPVYWFTPLRFLRFSGRGLNFILFSPPSATVFFFSFWRKHISLYGHNKNPPNILFSGIRKCSHVAVVRKGRTNF